MEAKLKELIKEAVLEALADYSNQGVETAATYGLSEAEDKNKDKDKKPGRPGPVIGPAGFSLR